MRKALLGSNMKELAFNFGEQRNATSKQLDTNFRPLAFLPVP